MTPLVNTTLSQGSSQKFVCAAVADPRPVFVFRFNGKRIMSNSSKHALVTNNTHGTLTVFNLQGSDEGTYTCSVSNRYGSVSTAGVLTVQGVFVFGCVCAIIVHIEMYVQQILILLLHLHLCMAVTTVHSLSISFPNTHILPFCCL